ncbi:F-box domain-containing protein [Mycena chlorophos]|uniref:F-box domain-containing protein n=1 Tax=Mycena chlorophos TaxID=658473 RepID=A0A8H6S8Q4_MYCCL|nr:F-box domain-containing protein [Mycena chlorophos]
MSTAEHVQAQIKALSVEIEKQQAGLAEMQSRLHALQEQLNAISCPILSLPTEIAVEIFEYALDTFVLSTAGRRSPPLSLTETCRTWREIALTSPTLWSSFNISLYMSDRRRWPRLLHLAEMWFSRAGNLLLQISLRGEPGWTQMTDGAPFIPVLERFSPRISHLHLEMATQDLAMLDAHSFNWDRLVSFSFWLQPSDAEPVNSVLYDLFHAAPSLRRVRLASESMLPSSVDLPWSSVDHFSGGGFYKSRETLQILEQLPHTTSFKLVTSANEDNRASKPRPVEHINVRNFVVDERGVPHPETHILEFFTFPQLETLELLSEIDGGALRRFLSQSRPPLRRLFLTDGTVFNSLTADILDLVPSLVELELHSPSRRFYTGIIFTEYPKNMEFLPKLEKLSISCALRDEVTMDDLVTEVGKELRRRKRRLAELDVPVEWAFKSLKLHVDTPETMRYVYPERSLAIYRELRNGGVEVSISGGGWHGDDVVF